MAYQVLARKWRPQKFEEVIGQEPVTRTLRNAIVGARIAHAFVFAGPRGSGKTTTARILAKALNCVQGPTAEPCGACDACVEIAQGRDMDVLEIDAASHTQVDNIREVVLSRPRRGPGSRQAQDLHHRRGASALVAFLQRAAEVDRRASLARRLHDGDHGAAQDSRHDPVAVPQVFEFRAISAKAITGQLRKIADAETLDVSDAALALIARAAEGSMRDAQSALDQVMAFAGQTITVDEVSAVLGLVGRDLLFQLIESVVSEDGPRAFALADRAVESGHDLKLVCKELSRVVRDMMVLSVDPARAGDGELADDEREQLVELAARFSREDLMRAFDLLAKAELDIRNASQPRYHFEMVLLRWMHMRKLVPLTELMEQMSAGVGFKAQNTNPKAQNPKPKTQIQDPKSQIASPKSRITNPGSPAPVARPLAPVVASSSPAASVGGGQLKDAFLAEVRGGKGFFYNTVVAQAQRIEVAADTITFTFLPTHRALHDQFNEARSWLESAAERLAGRRIVVSAVQAAEGGAGTSPASTSSPKSEKAQPAAPSRDLKAEAMSSSAVQAMLDVFPAEISDVEEM